VLRRNLQRLQVGVVPGVFLGRIRTRPAVGASALLNLEPFEVAAADLGDETVGHTPRFRDRRPIRGLAPNPVKWLVLSDEHAVVSATTAIPGGRSGL
jgi:hypothetical protein